MEMDVIFKKNIGNDLLKADTDHNIVFGFAMVSNFGGEGFIDRQGDEIPSEAIIPATKEFMKNSRQSMLMHSDRKIGEVIYAFPLIEDIAKSLGISSDTYGFMIGVHIEDPNVMKMVLSGEAAAFSIGGRVNG